MRDTSENKGKNRVNKAKDKINEVKDEIDKKLFNFFVEKTRNKAKEEIKRTEIQKERELTDFEKNRIVKKWARVGRVKAYRLGMLAFATAVFTIRRYYCCSKSIKFW